VKAAVYERYGPPEVIRIAEAEKPVPTDTEVLLRVRAASVNPADWHFMRGTPYFLRMMTGMRRPKDKRLGADVAGQVEAIGGKVTQFKPGDEVFGMGRGAFGEYACASESALAMKPDNVTFEEAASVPIAALTALQGLRDKGHIQAGQKVLINGASGGVGTFAVQIAKSFGADLTAVCSTRNLDMVKSLGADHLMDYTQEDFTKSGQRYDLILDCAGNHSFSACRRVLSPEGIHVAVGGPTSRWMIGALAKLITELVLSKFRSRKLVMVLAKGSKQDLTVMGELMKAQKVTPVIDRRYKLSEVAEAIRYLEQGHAKGKVVISN